MLYAIVSHFLKTQQAFHPGVLKSFKSQFHEGSSTSLCGFYLVWLGRLCRGSLEGEVASGNPGDSGFPFVEDSRMRPGITIYFRYQYLLIYGLLIC